MPAVRDACPADYDCDGLLAVGDIFRFLNLYFSANALADYNHSGGEPDVEDIFGFLDKFFSGCP